MSAHFLVDRDGATWQLLPATTVARHAIGLNHLSIGVENVGGPEQPLTAAQVDANVELVRKLADCYPLEVLIGHSQYRELEGSRWFQESDPHYRTVKSDPGAGFVARVRAGVEDLGLHSAESWGRVSTP